MLGFVAHASAAVVYLAGYAFHFAGLWRWLDASGIVILAGSSFLAFSQRSSSTGGVEGVAENRIVG
jgi:hypothetical protein